jgi:hypothetical protein
VYISIFPLTYDHYYVEAMELLLENLNFRQVGGYGAFNIQWEWTLEYQPVHAVIRNILIEDSMYAMVNYGRKDALPF